MYCVTSFFLQPTQEPDPWTTTFVADAFGHACPQARIGILWLTHPGWGDYNEDCLTLNIYAPNVGVEYMWHLQIFPTTGRVYTNLMRIAP